MLRPKDVADRLGISSATLRLWSTKFESFLSPAAQRAITEKGGAAQRRYTDSDVVVFLTAQKLLADGLTYEDVAVKLADGVAIVEHDNMRTDTLKTLQQAPISDSLVALEAYGKTISALEQTVKCQQETLYYQGIIIEDLRRQRDAWEATPQVVPAPEPVLPPMTLWQRLDWLFRGRMITGTKEERRLEPDGPNQRSLPVQELA